jgi:4-hydroxybenzoate polyprenyltransferase
MLKKISALCVIAISVYAWCIFVGWAAVPSDRLIASLALWAFAACWASDVKNI